MEINSTIVFDGQEGNVCKMRIIGGLFKGVEYNIIFEGETELGISYEITNPDHLDQLINAVLKGVIESDINSRLSDMLEMAEGEINEQKVKDDE